MAWKALQPALFIAMLLIQAGFHYIFVVLIEPRVRPQTRGQLSTFPKSAYSAPLDDSQALTLDRLGSSHACCVDDLLVHGGRRHRLQLP